MFKVVAKKGDPGKTVRMKILSPSNFNCRSSYSFIRSGIQVLADAGEGGLEYKALRNWMEPHMKNGLRIGWLPRRICPGAVADHHPAKAYVGPMGVIRIYDVWLGGSKDT